LASITGSSTVDWTDLEILPSGWEAQSEALQVRVLDAIGEFANLQGSVIGVPTPTRISVALWAGGNATVTGSGFNTSAPVVTGFEYDGGEGVFILRGNFDADVYSSISLQVAGLRYAVSGRFSFGEDTAGSISSVVIDRDVDLNGSYEHRIAIQGRLTFGDGADGLDLAGTVTSIRVSSGSSVLSITGLSLPADALNDAWTVGDIITALPPYLSGNDAISFDSTAGFAIDAGAGHDTLTGGRGADSLAGGTGNDRLDGRAGTDTLAGGAGNDTYVHDGSSDDVLVEAENAGIDTVFASANYALASGTHVERVTLTGTAELGGGNEFANLITGNGIANSLVGHGGNDTLDGGAGYDSMEGGDGDDVYVIGALNDVILEAEDAGIDTARVAFSVAASTLYTVGSNVENAVLTGTGAVHLAGNALDNRLIGNASANSLNGAAGNDTLAGAAGNDTYIVDTAGDEIVEAAGGGTDSARSTAATFALGANVEHLVLLGGALAGTGNASANAITGNASANTLDGGAGNDTLTGGLGDDVYVVNTTTDRVVELAGGGVDTIQSTVGFSLAALPQVENLVLFGSAPVNATGNGDNNVLTGNSGANVLDGGLGDDTMIGGLGDDTYVLGGAGDVALENADEGSDTVRLTFAVASIDLGDTGYANIENAIAHASTQVLTGTAAANLLAGNALLNTLTGLGGDDTLDGGAGSDTLIGGEGNDTYVLSALGDVVDEQGADAGDAVRVSYATAINLQTMYGGAIEHATLLAGGTVALTLTGNAADNRLQGHAGANTLDGGAGDDTLVGGGGNDTYFVDQTADVITEAAGGGTDTVRSAATFALGANVEHLVLLGGALAGTGNASANAITGNASANTLDGGAGNDTLTGGLGDDVYVVNTTTDRVVELAGGGVDTIQSTVGFSLAALPQVENLVLFGSAPVNATGNGDNNVLTGNSGANVLDGGLGDDTMIGGLGDDTYVLGGAGDVALENAEEGSDTVRFAYAVAAVDLADASFANIESVVGHASTVSLSGTSAANRLSGNALANSLAGLAGDDTLDGGAGTDTMVGGAGHDFYVLSSAADVVTELEDEGNDTVRIGYNVAVATTIDLATAYGGKVEHIVAAGTGSFRLYGNAEANALTANASANTLDGGMGADTLAGGNGNDTYHVDETADVVIEASAAGGTDTVYSSAADFGLGLHVERLVLQGSAGIAGTGNALANTITGNAGNNTLDGGLGNDTLTGGAGDDLYAVNTTADRVVEIAGGGTDTIMSTATFSLAALPQVENLGLLGGTHINATGNAGANVLTGNSGNNALNGGLGNDTLAGGNGDDVLDGAGGSDSLFGGAGDDRLVWGAGDTARDGGTGTDTLRVTGSGITLSLAENALVDIEIVDITGSGNNVLVVDPESVLASNEGGTLRVDGNAGDRLDMGTGWSLEGQQVIDGRTYAEYRQGEATLLVASGIQPVVSHAVATADSVPLTGNGLVDAYLQGGSWQFTGSRILTYSLNINDDGSGGRGPGGDWTPAFAEAVERAFDTWSSFIDVQFVQVDSGEYYFQSTAHIAVTLAGTDLGPLAGLGLFPDRDYGNRYLSQNGLTRSRYPNIEGDVFLNDSLPAFQYIEPGGIGFEILLHEIGHALGLKHPGDDGGNGRPTIQGLGFLHDFLGYPYTIMGSGPVSPLVTGGFASPMTMDVRALQLVYGANQTYHAGDDLYALTPDSLARTIWDTGGTDTLDASAVPTSMHLDLRPGAAYQTGLSYGNAQPYTAIASGVTIENAIGTAYNDVIEGNAANNILDGGAGVDVMHGAAGDDTYYVDQLGDVVSEFPSDSGYDTVYASSGYGLPGYGLSAFLEKLVLTGSGDNHGIGNGLDNVIVGNSGANLLGGDGGNDTIEGGAGDDQLAGSDGDDFLDGGEGVDFFRGGAGDDVYVVDALAPAPAPTSLAVIWPSGNNRYVYTAPAAHELTVQLADLTDDGLIDSLRIRYLTMGDFFSVQINTASHGDNIEEGFYDYSLEYTPGGIGASQRYGHFTIHHVQFDYSGESPALVSLSVSFQQANDIPDDEPWIGTLNFNYAGVTSAPEFVHERPDEGFDTIQSSISYALTVNVENLLLAGNAAIDGTGNALDNRLTGNAAANVLTGGDGEDTFVFATALNGATNVDTIGDFVSGTDRIELDDAVFTGLAMGTLDTQTFEDHFVYDTMSGALYYDADGAGAGAAVQVATLTGAPALQASDLLVA
jgi:Ca2+-binding RTX toxin-like protein